MERYDPRGRVNRALLVGVSAYEHKASEVEGGVLGDLEAVEKNLPLLRDALYAGGIFSEGSADGSGEDEVVMCRPGGTEDLTEALVAAAGAATGLLLFYFAGHGAVPSGGEELWLQMPKARTIPGSADVFPGATRLTEVLAILANTRAQRVVVVLDCCFAGNGARVLEALEYRARRKFSLLMSVQAGHKIDAGDDSTPTPFTEALARTLCEGAGGHGGDMTLEELGQSLREEFQERGLLTLRAEPWVPQLRRGDDGVDVVLAARAGTSPHLPSGWLTWHPPPPSWYRNPKVRRAAAVTLVSAALVGTAGYLAANWSGEQAACVAPQELRLLTDPDLENTVRDAAHAYLTSEANEAADGCPRALITVYAARAADAVTAFRDRTHAWQKPPGNITERGGADGTDASTRPEPALDPQRDVGAQPDIWIPASGADVERAERTGGGGGSAAVAELGKPSAPLARSPMVLAVPRGKGEPAGEGRKGELGRLVEAFRQRLPGGEVARTDPESADSGLLTTAALYASRKSTAVERSLARPGPPARTGQELLCELPQDRQADARTAALVPEYLLRAEVDCAARTRLPRVAAYPSDVPGLAPVFVKVTWDNAEGAREARDDAVHDFRRWLAGREGQQVFRRDGFWPARGEAAAVANPPESGAGTLGAPDPAPATARADRLEEALTAYRRATGPGRVLFLLDSSGSMSDLWEGTGGAPALVEQSLPGLGAQDEYGIWAVASPDGAPRPYRALLPLGRRPRTTAQRTLDEKAEVVNAQADPYAALGAALDELDRRGRGADERPQLVVFLTDGEDNDREGARGRLDDVLVSAEAKGVPVLMVSFTGGGCDRGTPDRRIADASGGSCLDASDDLAAGLRDEVARTGQGDAPATASEGGDGA
ncbi:substrate-binding domain-containing protein [Streptomyces longispororuber]|uniref:substrate-binding domain-containing protein n=1 Tax=Streptomyces longispororuber TaxID=68230 RepID=UPI0036F55479